MTDDDSNMMKVGCFVIAIMLTLMLVGTICAY